MSRSVTKRLQPLDLSDKNEITLKNGLLLFFDRKQVDIFEGTDFEIARRRMNVTLQT